MERWWTWSILASLLRFICFQNRRKDHFYPDKISHLADLNEPGFILAFEDLTEAKEMREKVLRTEQLAAVGRFSAGLAREIRNPLTSLSGSIQVLARGLKLEDSCKKRMEIVMKETLTLIKRVLIDLWKT